MPLWTGPSQSRNSVMSVAPSVCSAGPTLSGAVSGIGALCQAASGANLGSVWFAWGSRRLAAGCVGCGRGLAAGRSLGVAAGPDPAPARPGAARIVDNPWCLEYDILPPLDAGSASSEATSCGTFTEEPRNF